MPNTQPIPLVLIPGFMLDESLWDEFVAQFPGDRKIYRANLSAGENIPQIAAQIAEQSPARFILVGFSLGGYVARSLVEQFPERVAALILIASSLRPDTSEQKQLKEASVKATSQNRFKGLGTASIIKSLHPQKSGDKELIERIRQMGIQLGYDEFAKQSMLDRSELATHTIQCPTLIIAAAQDGLRLPEEANELHNAIPHSRFEFIEGSGHLIPLEQPQALYKIISHWLEQLV